MMRQRFGRIINVASVVAKPATRPGELRSRQGRTHRPHESDRRGDGVARHHGKRSRARIHRFADDRRAARKDERRVVAAYSVPAHGADAEVAAAIVFLASDEAAYITGHVLDINGGMRMG